MFRQILQESVLEFRSGADGRRRRCRRRRRGSGDVLGDVVVTDVIVGVTFHEAGVITRLGRRSGRTRRVFALHDDHLEMARV